MLWGDPIGALFCLVEMLDAQRRHLLPSEQLGRRHAAVGGNDMIVFVDEHRIDEAETLDRGGDLLDLPPRVGAGIARIGFQRGNGNRLSAG